MKFLKILGWVLGVFVILMVLIYGFSPSIGRILVTQVLKNYGATNIEIIIARPGINSFMVPSLTFHTSTESASAKITIQNTEVTYSMDSLLNNFLESVTIEDIQIVWDTGLLDRPSDPDVGENAPPASHVGFPRLTTKTLLPTLPFRKLRIHHVNLSNPLAPPILKKITLTAAIDSLPSGLTGTLHLGGNGLLLNYLTFTLTQDGSITLTGTHTDAPEDLLLALHTTLESSSAGPTLKGKTRLQLHPFFHTLSALYPLPPHYQGITGNLSGNWTYTLQENSSVTPTILGQIKGDLSLEGILQTWPPLARDIHIQTQGTFTLLDEEITLTLQPSSSGSLNLSLSTFIPPIIESFIRNDDRRSVTWNIREPVHIKTPLKQPLTLIKIPSGTVHMTIRNPLEKLDMVLLSKGLLWTPANNLSGTVQTHLSAKLEPGPTQSLHPEELFLKADASLVLTPKQTNISFDSSSFFRFSEMKNELLYIPSLVSRFPKGVLATYYPTERTLKIATPDVTLSLPSFSMENRHLTIQDISTQNLTISNTPESWTFKGDSTFKKIHLPFDGFNTPNFDLQAKYSATPKSLTIQFNGQTFQHPIRLGGQANLSLETYDAVVSMTMKPLFFAPKKQNLSHLLQPWPFPDMDVTHGSVSASMDVSLVKNNTTTNIPFHIPQLHGILEFKNIGGTMGSATLKGLNAKFEILGKDNSFQIPSTPIRIEEIHSTLNFGDTFFLLSSEPFPQATPPTISVRNVSTHLLGGTATLLQATYAPSEPANDQALALQVQGFDLGEILQLEQQDTVQGTGILDGNLPLFISGNHVEIHQGTLKVRPPGGIIQMTLSEETAKSWAQSQPNLDLIAQSLKNFHYSELQIGVDYDKNGILRLATQLKGKNPDFRNGVPIHFNLNIEENIPALLESLSLIQRLEDNIGTMITGQEQQSPKTNK